MDLNEAIKHAQQVADSYNDTVPDCDCAQEHRQLAKWLTELAAYHKHGGVSICVVTFNTFKYTQAQLFQIRKHTRLLPTELLYYDNGSTDGSPEWLAQQPDVQLSRGQNNNLRHGNALDRLVKKARYPIICTLCSDAFPISPDWLAPAFYLDDETMLAGMTRGWGRQLKRYPCPSFMFGWRDWVQKHSFSDHWPVTDTGEAMAVDCLAEGKQFKLWDMKFVDLGEGIKAKCCNYNDWVWHTWWGTRGKIVKGLAGREFEKDYPERVRQHIKDNFGLEV
jgi:glycosyltransferase involved in cell wall biosynthesis